MGWQEIVKTHSLAVSERMLSETISAFRFDAEYFQPHYLENDLLISQKSYQLLDKIIDDIKSFGAYSLTNQISYQENGIPFIRCTDVKGGYVDFSQVFYINEKSHELLWKSAVEKGTVILCMSGSVGNCAVAEDDWKYPINSNQDVAKITLKSGHNPYFFSAFLNSKYGRLQVLRLPIGSVQQHIFLWQLKTLKIPVASNQLQTEVSKVYRQFLKKRKQSELTFLEAEQLLLKEINLERYVPSEENTSVRELTDCLADNRFDAEYWQLKFDGILERINAYTGGVSTVKDEFSQIKNNFKSDPEMLYRYVEIGDVDVSTGEVSFAEIEGKELPANAKITLGDKQLVTSKVRPNRGATAILDNQKGYVASGAFVVLKEAGKVTLETLQVYLKTALIRDLLLRYNTGTAYPTIIDADILNLPLPLVNKSIQESITEKVKQCSKERIEAKELLEKAKRAVEIFIEKDEQEALKYLSSQAI